MVSLATLMEAPPSWFIHATLVANQFIWSGMHVASHPALEFFPPHVFAAFRMSFGLPFIAAFARKETEFFSRLGWRDLRWVVPLGVGGVAVPQWLVFVGNQMAGAGVTSAFAPLVPVNTAVMAGLLGQEQLTKRIVAGMALALSGTFSILHVETLGDELTTDRTGGILVLLFQNWTYAAYLVALKQIMKSLPFPVGIYFVGYVFGWLFLVIISVPYLVTNDLTAVPANVWLAEIYAGFFASFVAHVMNSWAVHHCTPTIPALYGCLQPVVGVALSIVLLGETFDLRDVCSVGLIIGGLVVVTMKGLKLHGTPSAVGLDTLVSHHHPDSPLQFELQLKGEAEDPTTGLLTHPQTFAYYDLRTIDSVQSVMSLDAQHSQCEAVAPGTVYATAAELPSSPMTTLLRNVTDSAVETEFTVRAPPPSALELEGSKERASIPLEAVDGGMQGSVGSDGSAGVDNGPSSKGAGVAHVDKHTGNIE